MGIAARSDADRRRYAVHTHLGVRGHQPQLCCNSPPNQPLIRTHRRAYSRRVGGLERRIAASHTRLLVERFRELPADAQTSIEAQARAEIAAVGHLSPAGWAPLQLQLNLVHALRLAVSEETFENFWREQFLRTCHLESLAPAIAGALRLFGPSPTMLMKTSGRMWRLVSRDCGELHADLVDPGYMVVRMTQLPTEGYDHVDDWAVAWAGVLRGGLDLIGRESRVFMRLYEPELGMAVYEAEFDTSFDRAADSATGRDASAVPSPVSPRDSEALVYRT